MSFLASDELSAVYSPDAATATATATDVPTDDTRQRRRRVDLDRLRYKLGTLRYVGGNIMDSGAEGFLRYFFRDPPPSPIYCYRAPRAKRDAWKFEWLFLRTPIPRAYTADPAALAAVLAGPPRAAVAAPANTPSDDDADPSLRSSSSLTLSRGALGGLDTELPPGADSALPPRPVASPAEERLRRLLARLARNHALFWTGAGVLVFAGLFIRISVGQHSFSGSLASGGGAMRGDYEAQRHWMEVTRSLPVSDWYRNTRQNDLLYWGLDYPPLSAYWAYLWGAAADALVVPSLTAQFLSRGYESAPSKMFMRWSVICGDLVVYIPAAFYACWALYKRYPASSRALVATALLTQPALLIIDHGHFQYNGIAVGLALWAVSFVLNRNYKTAALCFVGSFMFKHIALYYALPFFAVMLGAALRIAPAPVPAPTPTAAPAAAAQENADSAKIKSSNSNKNSVPAPAVAPPDAAAAAAVVAASSIVDARVPGPRLSIAAVKRVAAIGATVILALAVILAPFALLTPTADSPELPLSAARTEADLLSPAPAPRLARSLSEAAAGLGHVLRRMFPVGRNIFEDKVANFWCVSAVVFRWKERFAPERLAFFSLLLTLAAALPSCVDLVLRPTSRRFVYSLSAIAFAFFLFSFQVHEKSIIFPTTALTLLLLYHPRLVVTLGSAALFSMFPLLRRDGLVIPYVFLHIAWLMGSTIHSVSLYRVPTLFSTGTNALCARLFSPPSSFASSQSQSASESSQTGSKSAAPAAAAPAPGVVSGESVREDLSVSVATAMQVMFLLVHAYDAFAPASERYPFLKELMFAVGGFVPFGLAFVFLVYFQLLCLPANSRTLVEVEGEDDDDDQPGDCGVGWICGLGAAASVAQDDGDDDCDNDNDAEAEADADAENKASSVAASAGKAGAGKPRGKGKGDNTPAKKKA